jgi:hypothetical protein
MEAKETLMQAKTKELCGDYFAAIAKTRGSGKRKWKRRKKAQLGNGANDDD